MLSKFDQSCLVYRPSIVLVSRPVYFLLAIYCQICVKMRSAVYIFVVGLLVGV